MSSLIIIISGCTLLSLAAVALMFYARRSDLEVQAQEVLSQFFEFNQEVKKNLASIESRGTICSDFLDRESIQLIYDARKMLQHGRDLERFGIDAIGTRTRSILAEIQQLFCLDRAVEGNEFINRRDVADLSPREYHFRIQNLLNELSQKIQLAIEHQSLQEGESQSLQSAHG